jgi:hypothetical protein
MKLPLPPAADSWLRRTWPARYARLKLKDVRYLQRRLPAQLQPPLRSAAPCAPYAGKRIFLPLLDTSHYRVYHFLALAEALILRGAHVTVLLCDSVLQGCEIKSKKHYSTDPCLECRFAARNAIPHFHADFVQATALVDAQQEARLNRLAADLNRAFPESHLHHGVEIVRTVSESVIRHFYGAVPAEDSDEFLQVRREHIFSALLSVELAIAAEAKYRPDVVLAYMPSYSAWQPYNLYFRKQGVPVVLLSSNTFDYGTVLVNFSELYESADRFYRYVATRTSKALEPHEAATLAHFMEQRFGGTSEAFSGWGGFAEGAVEKALRLDKSKRNIFLFPNVFWDVGITGPTDVFTGVVDWVLKTVEICRNQPDIRLFIKLHPGEAFGDKSFKGIADFIVERFGAIPDGVSLITPEMRLSPYDLFPHIDLGVVYNSTLGIEMLYKGLPVVACGASPYGMPGLASMPGSLSAYSDMLLHGKGAAAPDPETTRLFAYFYFVKALIPSRLTKRVYADDFRGFNFDSLDDLLPGKDPLLDHLCACIVTSNEICFENW